ncbi:hypothetical protein NTE_01623 [Candidatus Nitrososphaera evergladensis SR1]|uniref:Uncharacterized protein n=2 Tax=Nitrososphaera TaxID=497726 RepID=A0A075MRH2_9ARCH|nr:hypothetical protein NTE_01623 [Candidatus Nitrososphaera evergladensis SR1]
MTKYFFSPCNDELGQIGRYSLFVGVLIFLFSVYIFSLAKRNEAKQSYEPIMIMPILRHYGDDDISRSSDGTQICTFSLKNVGDGSAKNLQIKATSSSDGRQLTVDPRTPGKNEAWEVSEWNVQDLKTGEKVDIEVNYTDIKGNPCSALRFTVGAEAQ